MKNVTSQLCDTVLLVAAFAEFVLNIHPPLHGVASGCNGEILLKIHNFNTSTKFANIFAISK
jgi:hypothetical protein